MNVPLAALKSAIHFAGAYFLRYAQEAAWREDNRRVSNGDQVGRVASLAMMRKPLVVLVKEGKPRFPNKAPGGGAKAALHPPADFAHSRA